MKKISILILAFLLTFVSIMPVSAREEMVGPPIPDNIGVTSNMYESEYPDGSKVYGGFGFGSHSSYTNVLKKNYVSIPSPSSGYHDIYFYWDPMIFGDIVPNEPNVAPGDYAMTYFELYTQTPLVNLGDYARINLGNPGGFQEFMIVAKSDSCTNFYISEISVSLSCATKYDVYIYWKVLDKLDTSPSVAVAGNMFKIHISANWLNYPMAIAIGENYTEFNKVTYVAPVESNDSLEKEEQELSIWETIIALPNNLLSWFTDLPGNIWNSIKTGFDLIVNAVNSLGQFILNLPTNIWNFIKPGFDWIIDGLSALGNTILDGLEYLFLPSDFSFEPLVESLQNKLGFIYQVPYSVISFGLDLISLDIQELNTLTIPEFKIFDETFINEQNIDLSTGISAFAPFKYITDLLCISLCVNALFRYKDNIFGSVGGGPN